MAECSTLYSAHYGYWAPREGEAIKRPVKLPATRIRELCLHPDSWIAYARDEEILIAYAIAIQEDVPGQGMVTWVTQLVVHRSFRRQNIAKKLLHALWGFTDHYAWGVVSANPYAVRALETATRRRCDPARIAESKEILLEMGCASVPYITESTELEVADGVCRIDTDFDLDHSKVPDMLEDVTGESKPWTLGTLREKCEWFAFTFQDQTPSKWSRAEVQRMLQASDDVAHEAYSRMTLDEEHQWARHTATEAAFIFEACHLGDGSKVLDLGCGAGRHCYELAINGARVTGVDFCESLIERARTEAEAANIPIEYIVGDCRSIDLDRTFDAVICLYDVVGSFPEKAPNFRVIRNIAQHLAPGGYALVSVMNMGATESLATQCFDVEAENVS